MSDQVTVDNGALTDYTVVTDEITSPYTGGSAQAQGVKIIDGIANGTTPAAVDGTFNALLVVPVDDAGNYISGVDLGGAGQAWSTVPYYFRSSLADYSQAALADADAITGVNGVVASGVMAYNGASFDRVRGDTTNGLDVDVTRLPAIPAGNNNIGDVDVLTVPAPLSTAGHGTAAAALRVELPTDGTGVIATVGTITNAVTVNSHAVTNAGTFAVQDTPARPATATLTNVNDSNVNQTLLSANANRQAATIWNDSTAVLYVKFGTTASATSATVKIAADGYYEFPQPCYTGRVDGIWASDQSGAARITELTP